MYYTAYEWVVFSLFLSLFPVLWRCWNGNIQINYVQSYEQYNRCFARYNYFTTTCLTFKL